MTDETVIAEIWPARIVNEGCRKTIHKTIVIERERDIAQDVRFGVRQLADIVLRALSPAVNDPTTGVLCIKYLQAVFEHFVQHEPQPGIYRFVSERGGLEIRQPAFQEYLEVFPEIGLYAGGNVRVIEILLTVLVYNPVIYRPIESAGSIVLSADKLARLHHQIYGTRRYLTCLI